MKNGPVEASTGPFAVKWFLILFDMGKKEVAFDLSILV
jgi:hypothetical protein